MTEARQSFIRLSAFRFFANVLYAFGCLVFIAFVALGSWITTQVNTSADAAFQDYGGSIHKYPFVNRYVLFAHQGSGLRPTRLDGVRILSLSECDASQFTELSALFACAGVGTQNSVFFTAKLSGQVRTFEATKLGQRQPVQTDLLYFVIDSALLTLSLCLSLLLFTKCRRFLSGYLISLVLLLNVGESRFFYSGANIFNADDVESVRLSLTFILAPMAMFFFPQAFNPNFWRSWHFGLVVAGILVMLMSYHAASFTYFLVSVSFALLVIIVHFFNKFRQTLNTKERKQVLTMLYGVAVGLALYFPLMYFGGKYGFLVGRYLIIICVGLGILFALMRYGLWQVDTLISKSATLSLLSVIAFSAWAGLDQGMQALLNQTIGLSNETFTAFLAAAISSFFAVPAYNYISKSCDAFFNKDLHQLKRLLSKDILVLAEVQTLTVFIEQLSNKLLILSGARDLTLEFVDHGHLSAPATFEVSKGQGEDEDVFVRIERFEYQIENVLSVSIVLQFADRRINREFKQELEEGTDEIARALASCARWNYLESTGQRTPPLKPISSGTH